MIPEAREAFEQMVVVLHLMEMSFGTALVDTSEDKYKHAIESMERVRDRFEGALEELKMALNENYCLKVEGLERPTPDSNSLYMVMLDRDNGITLGFERESGEIMPVLGIDNDGYLRLARGIPEWTGLSVDRDGRIITKMEISNDCATVE